MRCQRARRGSLQDISLCYRLVKHFFIGVGYYMLSLILMNMFVKYLQCWIYELFPSVGSAIAAEDYDERISGACRWTSGKALPVSMYHRHLNKLALDVVCWIPYGDHHSFREFEVISLFSGHLRQDPLTVIHELERVVRQFGYIQTISPYSAAASASVEEIDARWMQFGDYIAPVGQICVVPDQFSLDCMQWFYMILHPFMTQAQPGDPPRISSIQQYDTFVEPDVPQQPVVTMTPDKPDVDVHCPRYAVVIYFFRILCLLFCFFILLLKIFMFASFHLLGWLCSNY